MSWCLCPKFIDSSTYVCDASNMWYVVYRSFKAYLRKTLSKPFFFLVVYANSHSKWTLHHCQKSHTFHFLFNWSLFENGYFGYNESCYRLVGMPKRDGINQQVFSENSKSDNKLECTNWIWDRQRIWMKRGSNTDLYELMLGVDGCTCII